MRVGTWNLENLFRPGEGSGSPPDDATYDAKLTSLAGVVDGLAVDVLAVQEVGSPGALDDLVRRLEGSWHSALATPDARGIRVGVLSRTPLSELHEIARFPHLMVSVQVDDAGTTLDSLGRPALVARVRVQGVDVDVVSVHLKSKLLSFPGGRFSPRDEDERARYAVYALHRRAAEAAGVRVHVTGLLADQGRTRVLVVAGDLNDVPTAATTQILLGPPGSEIGTGGFDAPDRGDGSRLWNVESLIPEEDRYSRIYRGRRELIDHLLVTRAAVERVTRVETGGPVPQSVTDDPRARADDPASDHRPVVVTIGR
jgi:endonuclease/exonuclease/phosphatase family metal-dependent hydrolase